MLYHGGLQKVTSTSSCCSQKHAELVQQESTTSAATQHCPNLQDGRGATAEIDMWSQVMLTSYMHCRHGDAPVGQMQADSCVCASLLSGQTTSCLMSDGSLKQCMQPKEGVCCCKVARNQDRQVAFCLFCTQGSSRVAICKQALVCAAGRPS